MRLQEYDIVRVVKLSDPDREYGGSDGVSRPPAVGDIAVICHEYRPDDPTARLAVQRVDEKGHTVWLADFDPDELELIERPG